MRARTPEFERLYRANVEAVMAYFAQPEGGVKSRFHHIAR